MHSVHRYAHRPESLSARFFPDLRKFFCVTASVSKGLALRPAHKIAAAPKEFARLLLRDGVSTSGLLHLFKDAGITPDEATFGALLSAQAVSGNTAYVLSSHYRWCAVSRGSYQALISQPARLFWARACFGRPPLKLDGVSGCKFASWPLLVVAAVPFIGA